jgi:methionyl-tRNA formyltransferase
MKPRVAVATPHARYRRLVRQLADAHQLEVLHIAEREALTAERLSGFGPDYLFLPHWSWKVPAEIHERFETIIFHMTDVPYGRGGSPLQNLIRRGHDRTKLTALRCVEEMDAGPVYLKRDLSLHGTAEEIFARATELMEEMIVDIVTSRPEPVVQEGEVVTFKRLKPEDGDLAMMSSIDEAYDLVRMLDAEGYPAAFATVDRFRLEFSEASLSGEEIVAKVRIRKKDDA